MIYSGYTIDKIYYSGYTVTAAYSCGGYKVFDTTDVKMRYSYTDQSGNTTTGQVDCDSTSSITSANTTALLPSGTCFSGDLYIGNCVNAIDNNAFYPRGSGYTSNSCASALTMTAVVSIGKNAFRENHGLKSISFPNTIASIGEGAFYGCITLLSVTLPQNVGFNTIQKETFAYCSALNTVYIPSNVKYINERAFYECYYLTSLTVNRHYPPTVGTNAFYNTPSDMIVYVPASAVDAYKSASGWSQFGNRIQPIP